MKPTVITTWVLVCDASHARIFAVSDKEQPWTQVQAMEHPEGRLKGQDLVTAPPGRTHDRFGRMRNGIAHGSRSAMEPDTDPQEVEAGRFAQELAELLERRLNEGRYDRLLIAAPPHFLGLLRARIGDRVRQRIAVSVDHDYTWVRAPQLPERLAAYL
jgi:protein required for attachment to host cells